MLTTASTMTKTMTAAVASLLALTMISPAVDADSFIAWHSRRVRRSMFFFREVPPELTELASPSRAQKLTAAPPDALSFVATPSVVADLLALARERDRLHLFRPQERLSPSSLAVGASLFGVTTVLAAHLPPPTRVIFDAPVHLGPSIFNDGGVGVGVGGIF
jgi:hypothetical protein